MTMISTTIHRLMHVCALAVFASSTGIGAISIVTISGGGDHPIDATYDEKFLAIDATAGTTTLTISDISKLPAGFHISSIQKIDPSSNPVGFRVLKEGDSINHFWHKDSPEPIWLNLTQQGAELVCDGISKCHLFGKTFHRPQPQSQRTVVSGPALTSFNIKPKDEYEVWRVNAAGGPVGGYFDPVKNFTQGGYQSHVIEVMKSDPSSNPVTIYAFQGESINGQPLIVLNRQWEWVSLYIASDGINVRSWYNPDAGVKK